MSNSEAGKNVLNYYAVKEKMLQKKRNTPLFSTHVRMTKKKKDTIEKEYQKHKKHYENE